MPDSPTLTNIRSWNGLVNQLALFMTTTPVMQPLEEAKKTICNLVADGLVYYDKPRPTACSNLLVVTDHKPLMKLFGD